MVAPSKIIMMRLCSGCWMISIWYGVAIILGPQGGDTMPSGSLGFVLGVVVVDRSVTTASMASTARFRSAASAATASPPRARRTACARRCLLLADRREQLTIRPTTLIAMLVM